MMCTAYQYRAAWFVRSMVTLAMPMVGFSMVHMAKFREEPSQRWGSLLCAEPENGLESAFSLLEITCAPPGPADPGPARSQNAETTTHTAAWRMRHTGSRVSGRACSAETVRTR
jgi:hypothetical protein